MGRLSPQSFEDLSGAIAGLIWEADAKDLVCTIVSESAKTILGRPADYWVKGGHSLFEVVHPDDRERVARIVRDAVAAGRDFDLDFRTLLPDGGTVWLRSWVQIAKGRKARTGTVRLRGFSVSISDYKRREQELRHGQARLADIISSATDAIVMLDSHQNVALFNLAAEEMFGRSANEILGKPVTELIPASVREQHPRWVKQFGDSEVKRRRMGTTGEIVGLKGDGSWLAAEASISKVETNGERFYVVILRDITERKRAESQLLESEQRLQAQYKSLPIPTYSWQQQDGELILVGYNDSAEESTRGRVGPLVGLPAREIYHERPDIVERMRECMAAKHTVQMETEYRFVSTGRLANIDFTFVFVPPDLVLTHAVDVTEQRRTERALNKLSSAVEQTADSILITDRDGVIEYVNPAFEKLTGFTSTEALGKKANLLKSGEMDSAFYEQLWKTILAGTTFRALFLNRKKNETLYYEDKTISPLKDARGEITHFVSAGRDKTEQKRVEEHERLLQSAVENAAREWKLTFDAVESAILVIDRDGSIRRLNRTARDMLKRDYEQILRQNVEEFAMFEPWHTTAELLAEARESRQPASRRVHDATASRSWYVNVAEFANPPQGREMMIVTVRDITQIEELQESLRKSQTMSAMGNLVAGVAHEVRNPLFSVSATLDAFEARFGLRAEYVEYVRTLRRELERLNTLMQELLDYGKPASLTLKENAIGPIVEEAISACSTLAGKQEVEIFSSVPAALPRMRCDSQRLVKVFRNLLENAIQHSPKAGKIFLDAHAIREGQETWIECSVKDNGSGFRLEDMPHLFEPFFTRRRGGTGLGLAIVEQVVEQHGGKLLARNRLEGGAEVLIRFRANGSS